MKRSLWQPPQNLTAIDIMFIGMDSTRLAWHAISEAAAFRRHAPPLPSPLVELRFNAAQARVEFDENTEAFFGPNGILGPGGGSVVRSVPPRQKADLGVETLKSLIARIKGVFLWFKIAKDW